MKIFMDTNILLNLYRTSMGKDIEIILEVIKSNSEMFITVDQVLDEFARNRASVIERVILNIEKSIPSNYTFIKSLESYDEYVNSIRTYNKNAKAIIKELENLRDNNDIIYSSILKIYKSEMILKVDDDIFEKARKRKERGMPPVSDKKTIGDELIWETLLKYGEENKNDIILVTNDSTFKDNKKYLIDEYKKITGKELKIFKEYEKAFKEADIKISKEAKEAIENIKWVDIISDAISSLGGIATLEEIYIKIEEMMKSKRYGEKNKNNDKEATIRNVLQRYCKDYSSFKNKEIFIKNNDNTFSLK